MSFEVFSDYRGTLTVVTGSGFNDQLDLVTVIT